MHVNKKVSTLPRPSLQTAGAHDSEQRQVVGILHVRVSTNVDSVYDPILKPLMTVVSTGCPVRP